MVVVALLLGMAGTFLIGREQRFWEHKLSYEIRFARLNGLRVGSIVSLTGVDIGSVDEVSFPDDPGATYISVLVDISSHAAVRIREDSLERIRTIGLLGDKYVEISAGSPQSPTLPPGSIIPSADPIDYEALLGEGGDIITNIVEVTNSLKSVLASVERGEGLLGEIVTNREQGALTLADLRKTVAHVEASSDSFERIMKDVEGGRGAFGVLLRHGNELERLLGNLNRASQQIGQLSQRLETAQRALPRLVEDKEYGETLLRDLRTTMQNVSELSEKINHGKGTVGALVNDPSLYYETKGLVSSTRSSWVYSVYRGVRGLFPPYAPSSPESAFPAPSVSPMAAGPP
jgi:phospholipid/cholesterol/gamma-HCH transport system substrate-binding protein